ncbi:MAG: hypothetical protein Kow0092_26000 [Deferrisomatales bacterium]
MGLSESIAYVNARLRARKSALLGREGIRRLAAAPGVEEAVRGLADTPYGPYLLRASARETEPVLAAEAAFGEHLADEAAQVRRFCPEMAEPPGRYLFSTWDLENLKTVLRGVRARERADRVVAACTPSGWAPEAVWAELAQSASVTEALERAASMAWEFRPALRRALRAHRADADLSAVEEALDAAFYPQVCRAARQAGGFWRPLAEAMAFEVDLRNVGAALEWLARLERLPAQRVLPGGARTGPPWVRALASREDPAAFLARGLRVWWGAPGARAAAELEAGRFAAAGEALDRAAWTLRCRRLGGDPLSLDLLVGYLWTKAAEVSDLRRVVWALHAGLPPEWAEASLRSP